MFGVGGEHDLNERTLAHLTWWRDSRPVRIGNDGWTQQQVDVYGELLGAAYRLADQIDDVDADTRAFLVAAADAAGIRWRETDQGIWEVRGEPRHFLYSKVMCWVALDRAIALADRLGAADKVDAWKQSRNDIWETAVREGWNDRVGAFTQSFGSEDLDASTLMLPIVGFLPADDPRMLTTIDTIESRLPTSVGWSTATGRPTPSTPTACSVRRGRFSCAFWLAHALALAGQVDRARAAFDRAIGYVTDVGLLSEEVNPHTGELLGNFPQAFSHIGLVNTAWAISQAAALAAPDSRP